MVPVPLNCPRAPATTSHSYDALLNSTEAALKWNSVLPLGVLAPGRYLATKPNVAFPLSVGLGVYAPSGESIQPPPVTKPALGSYTTTYAGTSAALVRLPWRSPSVTLTPTVYTPAAA